jgi:endonuclease/exonuclease/phosphatase family metal-dependent hydrolase
MAVRRVLAVVSAAVAVVGALSWSPGGGAQAAESPAAAQARLVTLSFNMCGNKCNDGRLGIADHVADAVLHRPTRPKSIELQEVCARQAQRIGTRLAGAGYHIRHVPTTHRCDDGSRYGIALAYKGDAAWTRVFDLPNPGKHEPRKMVCAKLSSPKVLACATHIDFHGDGTRGAQIRRVAKIMADFKDAGHAAYVGGDFNTEPTDDQLDPMYRPAYGGGASGLLSEATGCCKRGGTGTGDGGRKIDYVFAVAARFRTDGTDVVPTGLSDHHKYWARLILR